MVDIRVVLVVSEFRMLLHLREKFVSYLSYTGPKWCFRITRLPIRVCVVQALISRLPSRTREQHVALLPSGSRERSPTAYFVPAGVLKLIGLMGDALHVSRRECRNGQVCPMCMIRSRRSPTQQLSHGKVLASISVPLDTSRHHALT